MEAFKKEIKEMVHCALDERRTVGSRPVPGLARLSVWERTFAVVVKGDAQQLESSKVKEKVLKEVRLKVSVKIRSIRNVREGIEIQTRTEVEAETLKRCGDFRFPSCGLRFKSPQVPRPRVLILDVPRVCKDEELIRNIIQKNLRDEGLVEAEMMRHIGVINRPGGQTECSV